MSFVCHVCTKPFEQKDALKRHLGKCLNKVIHQCPVEECGKIFSQSSQLKTHINVHTGDKPYACGLGDCTSTFSDPSSKTRHRKEVHGTTPHNKCPFCGTRIKRNSAFNAHLFVKHQARIVQPTVRRPRVKKSTTRIPTSNGSTPILSDTYTISKPGPPLWPSSMPQVPASPEANGHFIYSQTNTNHTRQEAFVELPLAVDPAWLHGDSNVFKISDDSSYVPTTVTYDTQKSNYLPHSDVPNGYDAYSDPSPSSVGSVPYPSLNSSGNWPQGTYQMFPDAYWTSYMLYNDLGSLGHGAHLTPLSLAC